MIWETLGSTKAGTKIIDGLLTVDPTETAGTLTIKATSNFDRSKTATAIARLSADGISSIKVVISPGSRDNVTVSRNASADTHFSAHVLNADGSFYSNETVTWSVTDGTPDNASIGADGFLHLNGEPKDTITVRAESVANPNKYDEVTVTIVDGIVPYLPSLQLSSFALNYVRGDIVGNDTNVVPPAVKVTALNAQTITDDQSGTLTYQWYKTTDGTPTIPNPPSSGTNLANTNGANTATFKPATSTVGTSYYYAVVTNTVSGLDMSTAAAVVGPVVVTVAEPRYSIALDKSGTVSLGSAVQGYSSGIDYSLTVTITNTGNMPTGALLVTLGGTNSSSFGLGGGTAVNALNMSVASIGAAGSNTASFAVMPNNLPEGTYNASLTAGPYTGAGGNTNPISLVTFNITFTVNPPPSTFIPVTDISPHPALTQEEGILRLGSGVVPVNASVSTVSWAIVNSGGSGASIIGGVITAPPGSSGKTLTVRAVVLGGRGPGVDFVSQTFPITLTTPSTHVAVTVLGDYKDNDNDTILITYRDSTTEILWDDGEQGDTVAHDGIYRGGTVSPAGNVIRSVTTYAASAPQQTFLLGRRDNETVTLRINDVGQLYLQDEDNSDAHYIHISSVAGFALIGAGEAESGIAGGIAKSVTLTKNYLLEGDLDLLGDSAPGGGENWTPVGNNTTKFSGVFDGNGHTLNNIKVVSAADNYFGLFGASSGEIRNMILASGSVDGAYSGAFCGNSTGKITRCINGGVTVGSSAAVYAGGITALSSGAVYGCGNSGTVGNSSAAQYAGGIAAQISGSGSITASRSTGTVYSNGMAGGLAGEIASGSSGTIISCYNMGAIHGPNASGKYQGGIAGRSYGTITACYNAGTVNDGSGAYSLVGNGGIVIACYWKTGTASAAKGSSTTVGNSSYTKTADLNSFTTSFNPTFQMPMYGTEPIDEKWEWSSSYAAYGFSWKNMNGNISGSMTLPALFWE